MPQFLDYFTYQRKIEDKTTGTLIFFDCTVLKDLPKSQVETAEVIKKGTNVECIEIPILLKII